VDAVVQSQDVKALARKLLKNYHQNKRKLLEKLETQRRLTRLI
jgi:hypothetical protein